MLCDTVNLKPKGKSVYFRDFIDEVAEDRGNIIEAEIVKDPRRVKLKTDEI